MTAMSNLHTHTDFCDGKEGLEQMVLAAIAKNFDALGFSGHGYTWYDESYCMTKEKTVQYIVELSRLKNVYGDRIAIFTGVEQDNLAGRPEEEFDFVIGSTHYIKVDGIYVPIDESREILEHACTEYFCGDMYKLAEAYYAQEAELVKNTAPDIVGHFDLIMKYNEDGTLFDPEDKRYTGPALEAMGQVLSGCELFEINTGAIYRGLRKSPYPAWPLLKALRDMGGSVIITSDSHDGASLGYKFHETEQLVRECGFKYVFRLTRDGVKPQKL